MTAFTTAGRDLIAQKQGAQQVLTLDRFVLANISGLDHTAPVNPEESVPAAGDIVWQGAVHRAGYVNPDQVVYSLLLGSNVGDFNFNWVGLLADDDTLVAVTYVPLQQKRASNGVSTGNNLTRNFLLAFTDAQATTQITVSAETWQIDFTARLDGIDERERLANLALYGRQRFINDGFKVEENAGSYTLRAGRGFIAGLMVELSEELPLADPAALPTDIWLDVALDGDITGKSVTLTPVSATAAQVDYTDNALQAHYLEKLATINGDGTVTDQRTAIAAPGALVDEFLTKVGSASETVAGIAKVATQQKVDEGVDDEDFVTSKKMAKRLADLMVGEVAAFATTTAPSGWLKCNGAELDREVYADLFAAIGTTFGIGDGSTTFNLPDLRGEFIRGLDDSRGIDLDRVLGSAQADQSLHVDQFNTSSYSSTKGTVTIPQTGSWSTERATGRSTDGNDVGIKFKMNGLETRPRNIALLFCIKY